MQDVGESKKYLDLLNGKTAFSVALVIFNIGSAAIIGKFVHQHIPHPSLPLTRTYTRPSHAPLHYVSPQACTVSTD